jgi:hypothetical protein
MSRSSFGVFAAFAAALLASAAPVRSELIRCRSDGSRVDDALARIRRSVDPCGESTQVLALLDRLERCTTSRYEICTNTSANRNLFDRPAPPAGGVSEATITWNPQLVTNHELGCDGDRRKPVLRDPTASLLHELVHAVQDCDGLNPGEHELEAVRMENIYRRAAGLCQRTGYGDEPLPDEMVKLCNARSCSCAVPRDSDRRLAGAPGLEGMSEVEAIGARGDDPARQRSGDRPE